MKVEGGVEQTLGSWLVESSKGQTMVGSGRGVAVVAWRRHLVDSYLVEQKTHQMTVPHQDSNDFFLCSLAVLVSQLLG